MSYSSNSPSAGAGIGKLCGGNSLWGRDSSCGDKLACGDKSVGAGESSCGGDLAWASEPTVTDLFAVAKD